MKSTEGGNTHLCSRCGKAKPLGEWRYMRHLHAWQHSPCGWITKVPEKVS